jgi:threonine dehydratase
VAKSPTAEPLNNEPPIRADVERARLMIGDRLARTPLQSNRTIGARLKCELFQRTGSFKPRGALNRIAHLTPDERARGVITISAGNHAQGVAWAAREEHVEALVVMWQGASEQKMEATRGYGAAIDLESANPTEAFERLRELQADTGRIFVDPHSDPLVLAGHGTVGLEIEEDAPDFDAVVVAVGGGGLVSGLVAALPGRRVIAVEPELAPALHAGIAAGARVAAEARSIADGCNSPFAGELAIEMTREIERVLVTEDEIEHAFRVLYERAKLACEPAGAVATAAWLAGKIDARNPVLIVSGGNVARQTAAAILARQ